MQQPHATSHDTQPSRLPPPPCGIRSNTRHCHLVAEPSSPHSSTSTPSFDIPLPLPPFPPLALNPVNFPLFTRSTHCFLDSLLPCCTSDAGVLAPSHSTADRMDRVHHERDPVMDMRMTRSRARSLERQAEQQKQQQRRQRATSTDKRVGPKEEERRELEVEQQLTGKGENTFQTEVRKASDSTALLAPVRKPSAADETATGVVQHVAQTAAGKAKPVPVESLSDELAQARKEEGLNEFTGEHPITPAPLQATPQPAPSHTATSTTQPATNNSAITITTDVVQSTQSMTGAETSQPQQQTEEPQKPSSRKRKVTVKSIKPKAAEGAEDERRESEQRAVQEERKEAPVSYREEMKEVPPPEEDNRSLFSTALPSPQSPVERKESTFEWDRHDSALLFDSTSLSRPPPSYLSDVDDKALAWQLQEEEYAIAAASRSIHTFLADLSYQPGWLRLSLAVCLVINVLLPLVFIPNTTAVVTLVCQVLQLAFAYWLYRAYDFTPHLLYSTALILPSLLYIVDAHLLQTGWSDVALLCEAVMMRPLLLLDGVVQLYIWQWMSVAVQAVELTGGMWLALKVR